MQIFHTQMNMVKLKRMVFFFKLNSTTLHTIYMLCIKWVVEFGLLLTQRRNKQGELKKVLAHHAALWMRWFFSFLNTNFFPSLLFARTHFLKCHIQSRFCAFHSVYWPIKMLCNKFAFFFRCVGFFSSSFFCCINSIEEHSLASYVNGKQFMVTWHGIFAQRRSPSSQILRAAHGVCVCVHIDFAYKWKQPVFYKVMDTHTTRGCSDVVWVAWVSVCMFLYAPPLCQVQSAVYYTFHM